MKIKMIICTDLDYGIGYENKLLAHVPSDLKYFKKQTEGLPVVMGQKTFEGLPFEHGLPNRHNIVLSRTPKKSPFMLKGFPTYFSSVEHLVKIMDIFCCEDIWVIGGASIYEQFKDVVDEVHWTQLNGVFKPTDTFFDMSWVLDEEVFEKAGEEVLCDLATVRVYKRR